MSWTLLIIYIIIVAIQLAYGVFFSRVQKEEETLIVSDEMLEIELPEISLLICAKNEGENLKKFLPDILEQQYPQYLWEVIVVNDCSTDNSSEILKNFLRIYSNLTIITISSEEEKELPGKKHAIDRGIAEARFETLLLTDADCRPSSSQWLMTFGQKQVVSKQEILLGYGKYEEKEGLLNRLIHWETLHTAIQYFSYSQVGHSYMGVGRNILYQKSLYLKAKKQRDFWEKYQKTASGDDDLLLSNMSHNRNTGIVISKLAQTISIAPEEWKTWWQQKKRHVSTGKYYPISTKFFLGVYALSHTLFWFLSVYVLIFSLIWSDKKVFLFILFLFIWRNYVYVSATLKWSKKLGENIKIFPSLLFDFGWSIYNVFLSPYIFWKNKKQWK